MMAGVASGSPWRQVAAPGSSSAAGEAGDAARLGKSGHVLGPGSLALR